jgi:uncharacterized DUF497 family protein
LTQEAARAASILEACAVLIFSWDRKKAQANLRKHGVPFAEAATVFGDPLSLTVPDPLSSDEEPRFVILGLSAGRRLLVVVHAARGESLRIISARPATRRERRDHEETKTGSGR